MHPSADLALRYILLTSLMIIGAKVGFIALKRFKVILKELIITRRQPIFAKLYQNINAYELSIQDRKQTQLDNNDEFIYGEILFSSFAELLSIVKPRANEKFYDLGCGSGKAIFTAALIYPELNCVGIEYIQSLHELCLKLREKYHALSPDSAHSPMEFIRANFLEYDFSDANIIFINATCLNQISWEILKTKFKQLQPRSRIIITSKTLESPEFRMIENGAYLMSWGRSSVYVYEKQ